MIPWHDCHTHPACYTCCFIDTVTVRCITGTSRSMAARWSCPGQVLLVPRALVSSRATWGTSHKYLLHNQFGCFILASFSDQYLDHYSCSPRSYWWHPSLASLIHPS